MAHIVVKIGDILESKAHAIVNTVNCVGVMGKGIALEFKKKFPEMYEDYEKRCKAHEVNLGKPYLYKYLIGSWVINFPTKGHWRTVSRLSDIEEGLDFLEKHYKQWEIQSLAVPSLGCGHGQLEWRVVGPILYRHLSRFDIPIEIYAPFGTADAELQESFLRGGTIGGGALHSNGSKPQVPASWAALAEIVARIECQPYHWPIGRVAFQKIGYFATALGIPTGLEYDRGSYGPFTNGLKRIESALINNGFLEEESRGRLIAVRTKSSYHEVAKSYHDEMSQWEPIIKMVVDLFLRMQTKDAEIAATVHFSAVRNLDSLRTEVSEIEIFDEVKRWKINRRPPLHDEDIARTIRDLNVLGLIHAKPSRNLPVGEEV